MGRTKSIDNSIKYTVVLPESSINELKKLAGKKEIASVNAGVREAIEIPVITIIPVTSIKGNSSIYPTEVYLPLEKTTLPKNSVAMIHQIRTISKERLENQCGIIDDNTIKHSINLVMNKYFELDL